MSTLKENTIKNITKLHNLSKNEIDLDLNTENENKLKYEMASILKLNDKDGKPDIKQISKEVLRKAIEVGNLGKKNPYEEKADNIVIYMDLFKENKDLKVFVDRYIEKIEELKSLKQSKEFLIKDIHISEEEQIELENKNLTEKEYFEDLKSIVKEKKDDYSEDKKVELGLKKNKKSSKEYHGIFDLNEIMSKTG